VRTTKDHYENHLAGIYAWMTGDLKEMVESQKEFFVKNDIAPKGNKKAVDLGCGHGIQSLSLTELGFDVTAVDFSRKLLDELEQKSDGKVHTIEADLTYPENFAEKCRDAELVVCMGDTLTHLDSVNEVQKLLAMIHGLLNEGGKTILSYRILDKTPRDTDRFINVRSDESRILTCFLEDDGEKVKVNDIIHEFDGKKWNMKVSSYKKLRLTNESIKKMLTKSGFETYFESEINGMEHIISQKIQ